MLGGASNFGTAPGFLNGKRPGGAKNAPGRDPSYPREGTMRQRLSRLLLAVVAIVAGVFAVATPNDARAERIYVGETGSAAYPAYRPTPTLYISGDSSLRVSHVKWSSYGGKVARATGSAKINDGIPTNGEGTITTVPTKVEFSRVRRVRGRLFYTLVTLRFAQLSSIRMGLLR